MRIRISRENLLKSINIVARAVSGKTTMSIMQCIMINASGTEICLIANDLELGIQTIAQGIILERGMIAVDAQIFSNIVRKLPDNDVSIETSGEKVMIRCENSKFAILGREGSDFPFLPEIDRSVGIRLSQYTLRDMISRTIFSISSNESNGMMTGELLEINGHSIRMVALDGHRIAMRKNELRDVYENRKVIIPGKTLQEISRILSGDTERTADLFFTDKHILFAFDSTIVVSRLIEGEYYKIDKMLSSNYATRVICRRKDFLDCLDRATLLVKEEDKKPVIIMLREDEMELRINTTIGSMDEIIPIRKEGNDLNIGFNPKFLIEALRAVDEEEVVIYLMSPKAPCFIRDAEDRYCYLILPVNFITID
ncbi:MAG: DNA polymerase III subunit beta [Eubacteriales bacterium]|nr:DNA polymerase III subunit beta [Eubacteriales bacterium]